MDAVSRRVTITSTTTGTMSALNMAMNGNAYKMIEIKKVSGPVVPLRWVVIGVNKISWDTPFTAEFR